MSTIQKVDQHIGNYVVQKQLNPDTPIVLRAYQKHIVETVDSIVELAHGQRDYVTSESDWKVVEALLVFFAKQWPHEFEDFKSAIPQIREAKGDGYSKSREIMHVGSIPPRFMRMVKAIFPLQTWDKKFTSKFVKKYPLFKVGSV